MSDDDRRYAEWLQNELDKANERIAELEDELRQSPRVTTVQNAVEKDER